MQLGRCRRQFRFFGEAFQRGELPTDAVSVGSVTAVQLWLWQEWGEAKIREGRIGDGSQIEATGDEGPIDVLSRTKVDEGVVGVIQVRSIVDLEEAGIGGHVLRKEMEAGN